MSDLEYEDDKFTIPKLANDSVVANAVTPVSRQRTSERLTARPRIATRYEFPQCLGDSSRNFAIQLLQLLGSNVSKEDAPGHWFDNVSHVSWLCGDDNWRRTRS